MPNKTRVRLVFDMTSFKADTAKARQYLGLSGTTDESTKKQVTDNMLGASVLNAKRFPTASFEVASAKATGQTGSPGLPTYELIGQFTLHGVTKTASHPGQRRAGAWLAASPRSFWNQAVGLRHHAFFQSVWRDRCCQ